MVDVAKLAIEVDSSQVTATTKNLDKMGVSASKAGKSSDDLAAASKKSNFQMRQTAMQLSQVASQGAVTGNYLQALAIQLPDLALALGPIGIIAGAVAGSLAGPLINALSGSTTKVADLIAIVDELNGSFDEAADGSYKFSQELVRLARLSEEIARLKVTINTEQARKNVINLGDEIRETFNELTGDQFLGALDKLEGITISDKIAKELGVTAEEAKNLTAAMSGAAQSTNPDDYNNLANTLTNLLEKYNGNYGSVRKLSEGMLELVEAGSEAATVFNRLSGAGDNFDDMLDRSTKDLESLQTAIPKTSYGLAEWFEEKNEKITKALEERQKLIDTAQNQLAQMMSRDAMAAMSPEEQAAQMLGQTMQKYQQFRDKDRISHEQFLSAKELAEERYYARIAQLEEDSFATKLEFNQATLGAVGQFIGNLTDIAQAGGEDQFKTWKRLAQAQAGVSAAMAVLSVLGDPTIPAPLKPLLMGSFGALAAVQIAKIDQMEYSGSREFGGQVQPGTSYLVGERGPEVITMGNQSGNVTPNSKLSGDNTTVVLQVSTGVQSTVRAELTSMMPMIVKTAQQVAKGVRR